MGTTEITIPYNFTPRDYQLGVMRAMDNGYKRLVCVWHRRAGKDKTFLNLTVKKMFERVGNYYYFFPTYKQGKKVIWDGRDGSGFRFLDHFPEGLVKKTNETELKIELRNGSIFQIIGTDNIDSVVGTNPVGCVFSEFSLQDPQAWDYVRPILAENGGWALFNFTPRGENHAFDLLQMAEGNDNWYAEILTVDDTGAIAKDVLRQEREEIIQKNGDDSIYMQEFYCSFEASLQGSYYGELLRRAKDDGRISTVDYDEALPVHTAWDLGVGDATAIWFFQCNRDTIGLIDYYEAEGEGLKHYIKVLQDRGYLYGRHFAPHDIKAREFSTGVGRLETAKKLGIEFDVVVNHRVDDGIDAVRLLLGKCWFDGDKCARGLKALRQYHKEYDESRKMYRSRPEHDWSSHGSDAFRYLAMAYNQYLLSSTGTKKAKVYRSKHRY